MTKQYLESLIAGIVSYPDDIAITEINDEMGILLTLKVNKDDMGKVIGKEGATAIAIRNLVRLNGFLHQKKVSVKIVD